MSVVGNNAASSPIISPGTAACHGILDKRLSEKPLGSGSEASGFLMIILDPEALTNTHTLNLVSARL